MCDINTLQQKIADLTDNGEIVIRFLAETVQGKTPAVQPCHRLEATSQLIRLGYPDRHSRGDDNPSLTRHSRDLKPALPCATAGPPDNGEIVIRFLAGIQSRRPRGHLPVK